MIEVSNDDNCVLAKTKYREREARKVRLRIEKYSHYTYGFSWTLNTDRDSEGSAFISTIALAMSTVV